MNIEFIDPSSRDEIIDRITKTCNSGFLPISSPLIPNYTAHAYRRVILDSGQFIGWLDKEKQTINPEPMVKQIDAAINIINKAYNGLFDSGMDLDTLLELSPVLVLESLMHKEEADLVFSLAQCHIYSSLALVETSYFIEECQVFFDNKEIQPSIGNLQKITNAQSHLMVAQEATNKALKLFYDAQDLTRDKVGTTDEVTLQLEIERLKAQPRHAAKAKNKLPENLNYAINEAMHKIIELDTEKQLYICDIAELTRRYVIDRSEYYKIGWHTETDAYKVKWFEDKIKGNSNVPDYTKTRAGKKDSLRQSTIDKISSNLAI